jgi:hypothetical protein
LKVRCVWEVTVRTRAKLIIALSELQVKRLWGEDYPLSDEYLKKKYWKHHDNNCKLETKTIKARIARELIWKTWKGGTEYGKTI